MRRLCWAAPEGLTVFMRPAAYRRRLRTTNLLERLNKEVLRRTRVATLFPNEAFPLETGERRARRSRSRMANRYPIPQPRDQLNFINTKLFTEQRLLYRSSTNRFADSWLGALPVPLPKNYILGIDLQQKDFEHYDRPSYLRGEWRDHGWWYYYLYAALIKVPLGLWGLSMLALSVQLSATVYPNAPAVARRDRNFAGDCLVLLLPPLIIICVASVKSGFSEHFRYVLPCFPFLFIWVGQLARIWAKPASRLKTRAGALV